MITFAPRSIASWKYRLDGVSELPAALVISIWKEEGRITLGGREYEVIKQSPMGGYWGIRRGDDVFADAQKVSAMLRTFEIGTPDLDLVLRPKSAFSRIFFIEQNDIRIGTIRPRNWFSRKGRIECDPLVPELVQLFCLWITAMMWRRSRRN